MKTFALAPSNKLIWYCSTQYSVVIGGTLHQYIQSIYLSMGMFANLAVTYLGPTCQIVGSAGLNTASAFLPYTCQEGGNKGQGNLRISTHRPPCGNASYLSSTVDVTFIFCGRQATHYQCQLSTIVSHALTRPVTIHPMLQCTLCLPATHDHY